MQDVILILNVTPESILYFSSGVLLIIGVVGFTFAHTVRYFLKKRIEDLGRVIKYLSNSCKDSAESHFWFCAFAYEPFPKNAATIKQYQAAWDSIVASTENYADLVGNVLTYLDANEFPLKDERGVKKMAYTDLVNIGSTPPSEECIQLGTENYDTLAFNECTRYIEHIRLVSGVEPEGALLAVKAFPHDFGTYHEVICYYDETNAQALDYAFFVEDNGPDSWSIESGETWVYKTTDNK